VYERELQVIRSERCREQLNGDEVHGADYGGLVLVRTL